VRGARNYGRLDKPGQDSALSSKAFTAVHCVVAWLGTEVVRPLERRPWREKVTVSPACDGQ
jgi:hypothetical protein